MEPIFKYFDLTLVCPEFDSVLTDLIIELDYLRKKVLYGSTSPFIFFQLKHIFHTLESIGSARIEGNNTTTVEYIETKLNLNQPISLSIREIVNMEQALEFIDKNEKSMNIDGILIAELHKMVVNGLPPAPEGEGDATPGEYRNARVQIARSSHVPPDPSFVPSYMDELFNFINKSDRPKYDLLKIAIAHHRFAWIHPFRNGNGRTVRLLTYAMLVKLGFHVNVGRILNPTAVFCGNRDQYYSNLARADTGTSEGMLEWCEYVLRGLRDEIHKIDQLLDYEFLKKNVLSPAIVYSLERKFITEIESRVLKRAVERQVIMANDIKGIFPGKLAAQISRYIKNLIDKKMLMPEGEKSRKYLIRFDNNYLLRGIIKSLGDNDFLPAKERA